VPFNQKWLFNIEGTLNCLILSLNLTCFININQPETCIAQKWWVACGREPVVALEDDATSQYVERSRSNQASPPVLLVCPCWPRAWPTYLAIST
jgi:hypothetical protein